MKYEKGIAELILFDNSDVVVTSPYFCINGFDRPGSGCADGVHENYMR